MLWRNVFFSRLFFWYLKQQLVRVLFWIKLWIVKACRTARVFLQFFSDDILILLFLFLWCHFQRYFILFPPMAIYETWIISTYQIVSAWLLNKLAYYIPTLYILHLCLLCSLFSCFGTFVDICFIFWFLQNHYKMFGKFVKCSIIVC